MANPINISKKTQTAEIMRTYQGLILDVLEQNFGEHKSWQGVRSRVLRLLGDNGLSKRVQELVEDVGVTGGAQ